MARVNFEMIPGTDGTGVANPLTDIRQKVVPPLGAHRDLLVTLGFPFSGGIEAYRTAALSKLILDLDAAGILAKLDFLYASGGGTTGSIVDVLGGAAATLNGTSISAGVLHTDGVASYFQAGFTASKYQMNNCCAFVYLMDMPPAIDATEPIIGVVSGADALRLNRNSGSPFQGVRCNTTSSITMTGFSDSMWGPGLWMVGRSNATDVRLIKDGETVATGSQTATTLPTTMSVGRSLTAYASQGFTLFGAGANLSTDERNILAEAAKTHAVMIQAAMS